MVNNKIMEFKLKNDELLAIKSERPTYLKDNIKGDVFHDTYLDYLYLGYARHYGIVVKPDFIWFTILNEISRVVKESPDNYRDIFTDSKEKKEVVVFTNDPVVMPIDVLLDSVFELIPKGLKKDNVILNFSTTTDSSKLAFSTSFLEAASPFYCYSMFLCGFNKINVLGTIEDYKLMKQAIADLLVIFSGKKIVNYFNKVNGLIDDIINQFDNEKFWKDIFYVERCGSGSEEIVKGWFSKFFDDFKGYKMMSAYPKHVAIVDYKNLSTNLSYKMKVGLFSSVIENEYLVPDFEFGINDILFNADKQEKPMK